MRNRILLFIIFFCFVSYGQNIKINSKERASKLSFVTSKKIIFVDKSYTDFHLKIENSKDIEIICEDADLILNGNIRFDITNCENVLIKGLNFKDTKGDLLRITDSNNIILEKLSFLSCGSYQTGSIVRIEGETSNIKIEECIFDDSRAMSINIVTDSEEKFPHGIKILKNKFKDIKDVKFYYPKSNGNGMECIVLGRGYHNTMYLDLGILVEGNYFENIVGDNNEVISIKSSKNLIKNNYFKNCTGSLTCRVGEGNILKGNTFVDGKKAIRIFGKNHIIEDNLFQNNKVAIELKYGDYSNNDINIDNKYNQVENLSIINNVFVNGKENIKTITKKAKFNPINVKVEGNKYD